MMIRNSSWPLVKNLLLAGSQGYYITRDGWITVCIPSDLVECEFPTPAEFDQLDPQISVVYDRNWSEDFEKNFKNNLLRSNLSNE